MLRIGIITLIALISGSESLVAPRSVSRSPSTRATALNLQNGESNQVKNFVASSFLAASIAVSVASFSPAPAYAYEASDYASDTVQETVQKLKAAGGNVDATYKVYEDINSIITEGRGVGGMINYQGIELERGFIADEDTSIYNPGLTLLTESEKGRLVEGVVNARKAGLQNDSWNQENELAFQFLREKLDPYHMQELSGYLKFVPFYGAFLYVVVLGIQQNFREQFVKAYFIAAAAFFLPVVVLSALGS